MRQAKILTELELEKTPIPTVVMDKYGTKWARVSPLLWISDLLESIDTSQLAISKPRQHDWLAQDRL